MCRPLFFPLLLGLMSVAATIAVAEPAPVYLTQWGTRGSDPGQFFDPLGIAIDSSSSVYVSDCWGCVRGDEIQKFTNTGTLLTTFGPRGSADGQLSGAEGLAFDTQNHLYIADASNRRVVELTDTGAFIAKWGELGHGDGQFDGVHDVAIDADGNVYATDEGSYRVQKFTASGTFLAQWGSVGDGPGQFQAPWGIAIDGPGHLVYVTDFRGNRVEKFDLDGNFLGDIGTGWSGPQDVDVDSRGDIYVADTFADRIQKYSKSGAFLTGWGGSGRRNGQFDRPTRLAVDKHFNLYVVDYNNARIQKFGPVGIASIADVGNDQGRWVRISFFASEHDRPGSATPIVQYEAFRRIDPLAAVRPSDSAAMRGDVNPAVGIRSDPRGILADWEFVGATPAHQETSYNMIAPTLADASVEGGDHWSVFFIRAATNDPGTFFDSRPDSGVSIDNLAPNVPQNFSITGISGPGDVRLAWDPSQDEDFRYFSLYRSSDPNFTPGVDNRIAQLAETGYVDPRGAQGGLPLYYKLSATDFAGNEGESAAAEILTPVALEDLEAVSTEFRVRFTWRLSQTTRRELIGVRVQRSQAEDGPYTDQVGSPLQPAASMSFEDTAVERGQTYWYRLLFLQTNGSTFASRSIRLTVADASHWRTELRIASTPGHGGPVEIRYRIGGSPRRVRLGIYDVTGREVRLLEQGDRGIGEYARTWDGHGDTGARIARGVYWVQLRAGEVTLSKRLVLAHSE